MECVTNAETGYFRPVRTGADSLLVFEYTGQGMRPVIIADATLEDVKAISYLGSEIGREYPVVDEWTLGSPRTVDPDSVITYEGPYHAFRSMRLNSIYPVVEGYKVYTTVGVRANFSDPVGLHAFHLAGSVSPWGSLPDDERIHVRAAYRHYPWRLWGAWNRADFYDLFGPTKVSRKGFQLGATYEGFLLEDAPKKISYNVSLARYWGLEVLPEYQNIPTSYDNFATLGASVRYTRALGTIGGIEAEKGFQATLAFGSTFVRGDYFTRTSLGLTWGFLTPLDHSSLWFRGWLGQGTGPIDEPFSNFFFGAFGNNWVDHGRIDRYRGLTSFPGVEIDDIAGRSFAQGQVEWTLPPLRFKKLGMSDFYATWTRLSFFAGAVRTNPDNPDWRRQVWNVGTQLNMKLVLFFSLDSTLSGGYAQAFEEGVDPRDEWMVSLRILH